jgi:hypothetical protein
MGCLDDKEPSDLYTASLSDEGRYRLLVEAVTDYASTCSILMAW